MRLGTTILDTQNITWAASSKKTIELPLNRWIRKAGLTVKGDVTTPGSAPVADGLLKGVITRARVKAQMGGGTDTMYDINIDRFVKSRSTLFATPWYYDPVDTINQTNWKRNFDVVFDFAVNPGDEFDMSAVLPAHLMSSLIIEMDLPANNVVTNMTTNTQTVIEPWVQEVFLAPEEEKDFLRAVGRKVYVTEQEKSVAGATTAYTAFEISLPTGVVIQRTAIFTANASNVLADGLIKQYKFRDAQMKVDLDECEWYQSVYEDKRRYAYEKANLVAGMTIYDAEQNFPGMAGLSTIGRKTGDLVFQAIFSAQSTVYLVHEQVV